MGEVTSSISVTCPADIARINHQKQFPQWWKVPAYIKARKAFVKRNPVCIRCGRPATTPGHSPEDYRTFESYLSAVVNDKCDPLCSACNLMERSGKKPCPECVKQKKERIRYIPQDHICCFDCLPPKDREAWEKRTADLKAHIRKLQDKDNARRRAVYQERKAARSGV